MPTENQNHPDDIAAIGQLHSQYVAKLDGLNDDLMIFQDAAYAMGLARGLAASGDFNLLAHLQRQREFSELAFGPGARSAGIVDHIRKELLEIEAAPTDISEWIDVVILAMDGAWRAGATPAQIIAALQTKQAKNESRTWPDWRTVPADKAIEHDRSKDHEGAHTC